MSSWVYEQLMYGSFENRIALDKVFSNDLNLISLGFLNIK